jgi:hypothetical protein
MFTIFRSKEGQAKMQWLQDPNPSTADKFNNARHEASIHFRNENREYVKTKTN